MNFIRFFIVSLIIVIWQINNVKAAPIDEDNVLKVGYIPNTGFVEENWNGHYQGYGYEYMEFLANYGHWSFKYIPFRTWTELGEALQDGEIDMMPCMPGDYRRVKNAVRTDHVIGRFPMELVVSENGIKPHMKIGTIPDNYPTPGLPTIAEGEGFTYDMVSYPIYYDMIEAFERGDIDGFVDAMLDPKSAYKVWALFDRQSYRLLVNSNNKELLDKLNTAMDQMLLYQPNIRDRLNRKYLRRDGFPLILSRAEREYLQNQKKLTTTIFIKQKPYYYVEDGQIKGAIPDILKRIGEDLGVEIEIIDAKTVAEARQLIKDGKVDFAADAICDYGYANNYNMEPTQSYMDLEYVPVRRQDSEETDDSIIACVEDLLYTKIYIEPHFVRNKLVYLPTIEDCFRAVSNGKADVVFVPRNEVIHYINSTDTYNLTVTAESYFSDNISLGVYKYANPHLWHILNKEINHLDSDWIRNVVNRANQSAVHFTPKWIIYHHPMKVLMLFTAIGLIISSIIWYRYSMRRKHLEVVQHMAYTDARYNLPNLVWLESIMPQLFEDMKLNRSTKKVYVAILAMERKAAVVERYGEELLIQHMRNMAANLSKNKWALRTAAGIDAGHLICICQADNDSQIREFLIDALPEYSYIETKDSKIWLHMRAGICEYKTSDKSVRQVVEKANIACHEPSNSDVQIFDDKIQENLTLQHKIEGSMEKALKDGEFKAWYQPKYDIKTRRIIGAEALVRWISPELGFMPPGKFIPLFEQNGFIIPVDYSLLEQAFQLQKSRLAEGKEVVPISVNQSRLHMTEEGYLDKIKAIIDKYDLSPTGLIELEVTETVFGDFDQKINQKRAADIISKLHEMGFTISVDDFGSGYSSFMMLNYLPMDVMKIDRSLLNASDDSKRMRDILANVISLGRALHMQVICEGIETKEQEQLLLELGCQYGQGFLNAKPMPVDDFIKFFEKRNAEVA